MGLSRNGLATRLKAALSRNKILFRKSISAQAVYGWFSGAQPNESQLRLVALYVLYGDGLSSIKQSEIDFDLVMQTERDLINISPEQFKNKYKKPLITRERTRFFIYALYSEAICAEQHKEIGSPLGMIGAYNLSVNHLGAAEILWGRVWFRFPAKVIFRGKWSSDRYAEFGSVVNFRFFMHEQGSISNALKGNYFGMVTMEMDRRTAILGARCWRGEFYDLVQERAEYRGFIYAEEMAGVSPENFDVDMVAKATGLIERAQGE